MNKKFISFYFLISFVLILFLLPNFCSSFYFVKQSVYASNFSINCNTDKEKCKTTQKSVIINIKNNKFDINLVNLYKYGEKYQAKKNKHSGNLVLEDKIVLIDKIIEMGFKKADAMNYAIYGLRERFLDFKKQYEIQCVDSNVIYNKKSRNFSVVPSVEGCQLDKEFFYSKLYGCLKFNNDEFIAKLNILKPKITTKDLKIDYLGGFLTNFSTSSDTRKHNIKTAIDKITGSVIHPGEVFSFNETTGSRSEEAGYKRAKIIVGGKYVDGVGGGVCQVSTTLFNACLLSGLEIVESHPHTLQVGYVDAGFDAMVNYYSADLKIKNNTQNCIYISANYENDNCEFKIFGMKSGIDTRLRNEVIKVIKPKDCEYVYDIDDVSLCGRMSIGEYKIVQNEKSGLIVDTFVDFYEKNKRIKTIKLRRSAYSSQQGKVVIGTLDV